MELSALKSILSLVGMPENTWLRFQALNAVILESDSNQFYNPKLQKIYFDTTNSLIKIKFSELISCSSIITDFEFNKAENFLKLRKLNTVYHNKTIREPRIGDKIGAYDPKLKTYTFSTISKIVSEYLATYVFLADNAIINKITSVSYGLQYFILLGDVSNPLTLDNPSDLYTEHDITKYDSDIYIALSRVSGLDFNKIWGN